MKKKEIIVIEEQDVLKTLCGTHDENLKLLESLFKSRVFAKGNEIFLDSEDLIQQGNFHRLIDEVLLGIHHKREPHRDYLIAIYNSLAGQERQKLQNLEESILNIPGGFGSIYPRNVNQQNYIMEMQRKDLVFGIGPAGTGKTYLAVAAGLVEVLTKRKRKFIITRPVVETGENLGFLPGDLIQKISPYLRPLYDAMESLVTSDIIEKMDTTGLIEVAPLAYMRGRSLNNCFVLLDEAQNTSQEQMKMFLTRLGENTRVVITGDVTQIDLPRKNRSGLLVAGRILRDIEEISFNYFQSGDVVRNPLVKKIVNAYETEENKQ